MHTRTLAAAVAATALAAALAGCDAATGQAAAEPTESGGKVATSTNRKVTLEATGEGTATITYTFGSKSGQKGDAKLPWRMSGEHDGRVESLYNVIVTTGESGNEVRCRILLDGKPVKTGKGEGTFSSADCALYGVDIRN